MIYTLTLNPALDYVMRADEVSFGKVNRSKNEKIYIGGKGINVSLILHELDTDSVALGFIGGFVGDEVINRLDNSGIKHDFVSLDNANTRINVKLVGEKETEINARGPEIPESKLEELYKKTEELSDGDILVIAGSVPDTLPPDIYRQIMQRLSGKNIMYIVDTTGELMKQALKFSPFLIKPNKSELSEIVGKELENEEDIVTAAKELQKQGARNVLVSMAKEGAILLCEDGRTLKTGAAGGKPVYTVGAGDSMVAGFIAGYLRSNDYLYALKMGAAAGGATAMSYELGKKEKITELFQSIILIGDSP